jgi:pimeloyl-ACP methyl ester carboxylesterase
MGELISAHKEIIYWVLGLLLLFWLVTITGVGLFIRRLVQSTDSITTPNHTLNELNSRFIQIGQENIHYIQTGQGPNLVLIHGIGASLFVWRYIINELAKQYTVTALDLPGFGKSSKNPNADYGLDAQRDRVLIFLDQLEIRGARIVGSSMGGTIALWLATKDPERFQKIGVISPATDPTFIPVKLTKLLKRMPFIHKTLNRVTMSLILRWIYNRPELVARDSVQSFLEPFLDQGMTVKTFLAAMDLLGDRRLPNCFADCKAEVLILYGRRDRMVFARSIDQLNKILPRSNVRFHDLAGHHAMEEEPVWCAQNLLEFFA